MVETKPDNQNLEKLESMETDSQYLFKNIKNQVIDRLLDDIDISKISKYPDLNEFVSKYAESPEKLEKDIDELSDSSNLLDKEDRSILETIKEKVKKPLAIVCLLGVLMTGSGAIEDQNRDSKLTQLANNLGINNVVHAEEEMPNWDEIGAAFEESTEKQKEENKELEEENKELEEENKELTEKNKKQEKRIKQKEKRLELLKKVNKQLEETLENQEETLENQEETLENQEETLENQEETLENQEETLENQEETLENQEKEMNSINNKIIEVSWKILDKDSTDKETLESLKESLKDTLERMKESNFEEEDEIKQVQELLDEIDSRL